MHELKRISEQMKRAEKELNIERWVKITICMKHPQKPLHIYEMPSSMLDRWLWVVRWRRARLICKYPKETINNIYYHYDKNTGLEIRFRSLLDRLISAKYKIIELEDAIKEYIKYWTSKDMFFNTHTDERLLKARNKLGNMIKGFEELQREVNQEATKQRQE